MPYRVNRDQKVLLVMRDNSTKTVEIERQVDFNLNEVSCSPLDEHREKGINISDLFKWKWAFNVSNKWSTGDSADAVVRLYANDVHQITFKSNEAQSVLVPGSGKDPYTVMIKKDGSAAVSCTCPGYRFRQSCKHLRKVDDRIRSGIELNFM